MAQGARASSFGTSHLAWTAKVALLLLAWASSASAAYQTIVDNGPNDNRVNVVFLGDGYTATQINTLYPAHINSMLAHLFNQGEDPYPRYKNFFNVHRIDLVSTESGADVPPLGIFHNTALDSTYYFDGSTDRLLYVNEAKANSALNAGLLGSGFTADVKLVTVNDTRYGGGGGNYAVYAGGNTSATEIALHESGHSFNKLADEYGGTTTTYTGPEPVELNVTKNSTGAKWAQWLGYNDPKTGIVGAYQGGRYYDLGIYRPSSNSKMRALGRPFDPIAREKIILDIYAIVDPLDAWLSNALPLNNPPELWVDTIDPAIIKLQWSVNGTLVPAAIGEKFSLNDYGFGPGLYTVTARAYDPTGFDPVNGWVRRDQNSLQQSVSWTVTLVPEPAMLGAFVLVLIVGLRRRRA
jgi:hypothetical protein